MGPNDEANLIENNSGRAAALAARLFRSSDSSPGELFKKMGICPGESCAGRSSRKLERMALARGDRQARSLIPV